MCALILVPIAGTVIATAPTAIMGGDAGMEMVGGWSAAIAAMAVLLVTVMHVWARRVVRHAVTALRLEAVKHVLGWTWPGMLLLLC